MDNINEQTAVDESTRVIKENSAHGFTEGADVDVNNDDEKNQKLQAEALQKELDMFKANPDNKRKAISLAQDMQRLMGRGWFSLQGLAHRTKTHPMVSLQKINMLKLFDLVMIRVNHEEDNIEHPKKPLYQITLTNIHRVHLIEAMIKHHTIERDRLIKEKERLLSKE